MKVVEAIKKFVLGVVGVVFFVFALAMTVLLLNYNDYGVTQFGTKSLIIINDQVSNDDYLDGDLVVVSKVNLEKIEVGDTIFAYKLDSRGVPTIQIGKVGNVYLEDGAIAFENGETYSDKFIAGKESKIYNNVGLFLSIVESKWGFLFIVLVPCFLIFIYQIYALIIEVKYGAEAEEN